MPDGIDWKVTTYEGNRRRQHEEFRARSFREKLAVIEQLEIIAEYFASRRAAGARATGREVRKPALPGKETGDA